MQAHKLHTHTHSHTESVFTTTAAPPVMTVPVPDEAIPNTVVVEINGFTLSMVTIHN